MTLKKAMVLVQKISGISNKKLKSNSHKYTDARQAIALLGVQNGYNSEQIADLLNKDRSSVHYYLNSREVTHEALRLISTAKAVNNRHVVRPTVVTIDNYENFRHKMQILFPELKK